MSNLELYEIATLTMCIGVLLLGLLVTRWCGLMLTRNQQVYRVRTSFLDGSIEGLEKFNQLPSYEEMLYDKQYRHLVTVEDWIDWLAQPASRVTKK